jgi:hypothetical protein
VSSPLSLVQSFAHVPITSLPATIHEVLHGILSLFRVVPNVRSLLVNLSFR